MLTLYMVEELGFSRPTAIAVFSYFSACVYFSPVLGGFLADSYLGKFSTILYFSVVYIAGIIALTVTSIDALPWGMFLGLGLIALGSGGIKPCVSAFGAEQYAAGDFSAQDVSRYFMAFYASINVGSILSYIITPLTRRLAGYPVAFSLSAIFLGLSVVVLVIPRKSYVHVAPTGSMLKEVLGAICLACKRNGGFFSTCRLSCRAWRASCGSRAASDLHGDFTKLSEDLDTNETPSQSTSLEASPDGKELPLGSALSGGGQGAPHWMEAASSQYSVDVIDGAKAVLGVTPFFLALPMFWALFDQNGSAFTLQAKNMELYGLQPDNTLILNPALVLVLIPAYDKLIFPCIARCGYVLTPLRKIGAGMALTGFSFAVAALVQAAMDTAAKDGDKISIALIIPQYVVITMSEILVSTIGQEWMFTQAPKSMKSTMMSMWFVSVGIGDLLAGALYSALGNMPQQSFYWLFAFLMAIAACIFVVLAYAYVPTSPGQDAPAVPSGDEGATAHSIERPESGAHSYQGAVLTTNAGHEPAAEVPAVDGKGDTDSSHAAGGTAPIDSSRLLASAF